MVPTSRGLSHRLCNLNAGSRAACKDDASLRLAVNATAIKMFAENGVEIKSMARHAVDRAIGGTNRAGVGPKAILDSLKEPLKVAEVKTDQLGRASQRFIGKDATTAVNPATGKIVSVNPMSARTTEKLLSRKESGNVD